MAGESAITEEMRAAVGVESEPVTHEVERGAVIRFAQAIGDPNPLFNDERAARATRYGGLIAPPTFLRSMPSGPPMVEVERPYSAGLDGGSEWEYFHPVRVGDRITVTNRISDIYERQGRLGNMLFIINEVRYVNQLGQTVALQRTTGISYEPPEEE